MSQKICTLLFCAIICFHSTAQNTSIASPAHGAANAYLSPASFNKTPLIPSAFSYSKNIVLYADYTSLYFLKELSTKRIAIAVPAKGVNLGFSGQYYGFELYNESMGGITVAKQLSQNTNGGLRINYLQNHIEEKDKSHAVLWDASFTTTINNNLLLCAHFYNPLDINYKSDKHLYVPTIYNISIGYFIKNHLVYEEIIHDSKNGLELITGGVFNIHENFGINTAFSNKNNLFALGATINMSSITIQTGFQLHKTLGASSGISLKYIL